jgi:hypothetical protein
MRARWFVLNLLGPLGCAATNGGEAASRDGAAAPDPLSRAHAAVAAAPAVSTTAAGMEVHSVYKRQVAVEYAHRDLPRDSVVPLLVDSVFKPYETFWRGYIGDAERFVAWARDNQLTSDTARLLTPLGVDFADELAKIAAGMTALTERVPHGTWYIVHGPGWTNLGGFGDGTMVVDFGQIDPDGGSDEVRHLLPHEINHLLFDEGHAGDPDTGTVLYRIINEGFASYVNHKYWGEDTRAAEHVMFTPEEWEWALEHETEAWDRALSDLESTDRQIAAPYVARSARLLPDSPGAIGYFLGYRLTEAYVRRHGPDSWRDLYELPVREVLARSGYSPGD